MTMEWLEATEMGSMQPNSEAREATRRFKGAFAAEARHLDQISLLRTPHPPHSQCYN
jgi:hypothetical protein